MVKQTKWQFYRLSCETGIFFVFIMHTYLRDNKQRETSLTITTYSKNKNKITATEFVQDSEQGLDGNIRLEITELF